MGNERLTLRLENTRNVCPLPECFVTLFMDAFPSAAELLRLITHEYGC